MTNEKAKEAKKRYMKEWRKNNKDRIIAYQEKYWEKKLQEMQLKEA